MRRLNWLDANMPGKVGEGSGEYQAILRIFPVPAAENLNIESDTIITRIEIINLMGNKVIVNQSRIDHSTSLDISGLVPGLYFIKVQFSDGEVLTRRFLKN